MGLLVLVVFLKKQETNKEQPKLELKGRQ